MGGKGTFLPGMRRKANGMGELDGLWKVERVSGFLPPLVGVRKRIRGAEGETTLAGVRARFDVVGCELRYRGVLMGLVDVVEPAADGTWDGRALFRGHEYARFRLKPATATRG